MLEKTQEQKDVVEASKESDLLVIDAIAGSGKTSTLEMVASENQVNSLLLVFNKSAQIECERKFPSWVTCKTTHSLAYASYGAKYREKMSRPRGGYVNVAVTASEIVKYFGIQNYMMGHEKISRLHIASLVKYMVSNFQNSADFEIGVKHFVYDKKLNKLMKDNPSAPIEMLKDKVLFYGIKLWRERIDLKSPVLIEHDTYLKKIKDGDRKTLTTSFRYGDAVADIAMKILEDSVDIKSKNIYDTVVGYEVVNTDEKYTMIYRTNANLILDAVDLISEGKSVNINIDVKDFCKLLQSARGLYNDDFSKIKHEDILIFDSWEDLEECADYDKTLKRIAKIITDDKDHNILEALKNYKPSPRANVTLITAHKAKGLEWKQVKLADDFPSVYDDMGNFIGLNEDEANLLYVACTRTLEFLDINSTVKGIVKEYKKGENND